MEPNVKVLGRYQLKKTFDTPEEFNRFYAKHKDEIDYKTSNQLNKEYLIKGFKITKRNMKTVEGKKTGELFLKQLEEKDDAQLCQRQKPDSAPNGRGGTAFPVGQAKRERGKENETEAVT